MHLAVLPFYGSNKRRRLTRGDPYAMCKLPLILLCCVLPGVLIAAAESDPLFRSDELLDITLTAPFDTIDDERDKDLQYDGTLSYTDESGQLVVLDVEFSVRGNWRLDVRNCSYSQLWVNFKRRQLPGTLFENQNRLKLVVQCNRPARYSDYIVRELKAYQLFGEVSDTYFDTRLVNVSYADSERPNDRRVQLAFFIEHQNRLAERSGFDGVEIYEISRNELHPLQSTVLALFMYMLGNTDFSMIRGPGGEECCHNGKMLVDAAGEYLVIPYDFDASGYIDTTYAPAPDPRFNLRSSRIRYYRGFCVPPEVLNPAIAVFQESRERMMAILGDTSHMSQRSVNNIVRYIEGFFEILDNPRRVQREFVRDCR